MTGGCLPTSGEMFWHLSCDSTTGSSTPGSSYRNNNRTSRERKGEGREGRNGEGREGRKGEGRGGR